MEEPLAVRSSVAGATGLRVEPPVWPPARWLRSAARLLPWVSAGVLVAGALTLRLYRLDGYITYYPDTYAQLRAVENLLSGTFPISYLYPPGIALALAPVFAFLPHTLLTMQAAVLGAGMTLVLLAYVAMVTTTKDRRAALIFAGAVALGAPFVFFSRVLWFDGISTLLVALSFFLAPLAARRGPAALLVYALLVFAAVTVRYTSLLLLPALFLYTLGAGSRSLSLRGVMDHARSKAMVTVGAAVAALYGAHLITSHESLTRLTSGQSESVVALGGYLSRLGRYLAATLIGYGEPLAWEEVIVAVAVAALAAVGARRLWQTNRSLLVPVVFLIVAWPPVHALYIVFDSRYVMPAFFFVLLLAALGLSAALEWFRGLHRPWQRVGLAGLLALAASFYVGQQLSQDVIFLRQWPQEVAANRENAYDEIRAVLASLDGPATVVLSSQALAIDQTNEAITTYDLIPHSNQYGINDDSVDRLIAFVREQQASGKTVYYHYTEYEDVRSRFRRFELGFDAYFLGLRREFSLRELVRAAERPQRLYVLEPRASAQ